MSRRALSFYLPLLLLPFSGGAAAIGLGEVHGEAVIGESLRLGIDLVGTSTQPLNANCFRLIRPAGNDELPWLDKATLGLVKGPPPILEIKTAAPLREPILRFAVQITCEHEVSREYVMLASPRSGDGASPAPVASAALPHPDWPPEPDHGARRQYPGAHSKPALARRAPHVEKARKGRALPDRLVLSGGQDVGEPSLRLATVLAGQPLDAGEASQARREILRLEFRTLLALGDQAETQMETAEKLRRMEALLGELQQRAAEFAGRVEQESAVVRVPAAPRAPVLPVRPASPHGVPNAGEAPSGLSEWSLYGLVLGLFLGLGGWLGWRNYQDRQRRRPLDEPVTPIPEPIVDPAKGGEAGEREPDFRFGLSGGGEPTTVDLELDGGAETVPAMPIDEPKSRVGRRDPLFSIGATTVDEHFEANPVMELADIMLSFGRVKGAAQALQEYIDKNPEEALQPWIRLMDVYRMAGMREEFENVARNLNQHFNVEIQQWDRVQPTLDRHAIDFVLDDGDAEPASPPQPAIPKAESLEELPRIMDTICQLWPEGDVVGYLYQLLRDNRGGQRQGFSLPIVEEILFMIELKETANRGG